MTITYTRAISLALALLLPMAATKAQSAPKPEKPDSVSVKPFGKTAEGKAVQVYTLTNKNGMEVGIATYGGTVVKLLAPDRNGKLADVALGFDSAGPYTTATYLKANPFFGALIGRYANRIAKGRFTLDGKTYKLAINNAPNTLHGGTKGFDKRIWNAEVVGQNPPSVRFSRVSPDGEENFPGTFKVAATYTLTDANELKIQYEAVTDKPTVANLTSHIYFNLAGHGSILAQQVKISAGAYTPVDANLIPTGQIKDVTGTPFDLRKWTTIGTRIAAVGGKPAGYDHNFVINRGLLGGSSLAAQAYDPGSGRLMKVYTDQPGVQFYTGNFLDGTLKGKGGKTYYQHDAFCLETQHFPDSPNQPKFPSTTLRPGEVFQSTTVYKFATK